MNRKEAPQSSASADQHGQMAAVHACFVTRTTGCLAVTVRPPARLRHLTQVAEQPLHRALGLTDWEAGRIQELLGREPNHFELAVFSLLWSEHCGYKHSAPLLKRLPSAGRARPPGPRRERGRPRPRRRPRRHVQGRVAQPPVRGRAVPGRGDRDRRDPARHRRDGRAADRAARRALVRRARPSLRARGRGHRRLRQLGRRRERRRRDRLRRGVRRQLPRQRDVRRDPRLGAAAVGEGARARATSSSSTARRPAATGSAARRCSRARSSARTTRTSGPRCRSATRSPARS